LFTAATVYETSYEQYSWLITHHRNWKIRSVSLSGYTKYFKNSTCGFPASCSELKGECKGTVHARCCHWIVINAALSASAAALFTARCSYSRRKQAELVAKNERSSLNEPKQTTKIASYTNAELIMLLTSRRK